MATYPKPSQMEPEDWSPNQLAKRDKIILATTKLMSRDGIKGCTARSVASASDVSTSALHYYFRDTDEIVDLAFRQLMDRFFSKVETVANEAESPVCALWNACCAYLEEGNLASKNISPKSRSRRAPMLWFEFHIESLRTSDLRTVQELSARGAKLFTKLITDVGAEDPSVKGESLYCALLGAAIRDTLFHRDASDLATDLLHSLGLPRP